MTDDHYGPHPYTEHVPHYYGDAMRQLFISAAALMLIGAPFYADTLSIEFPLEIIGALVLVALAALANPHNKSVFVAGAVAAGVGLVIYERWALYMYFDSTWLQFILREAIAVIFLVAFYFNMKTVRAFIFHTVGRHDEVGEFEELPAFETKQPPREWHEEFIPWFLKNKAGKDKKKRETQEKTGPRMSPGRSPEEIKPKYHPYEDTM